MTEGPLWAPWRMDYIQSPEAKEHSTAKPISSCFLCDYANSTEDAENLVVVRNEQAFVALNRYPYNNGHLLVAPLQHKSCLTDLSAAEHLACMDLLSRMTEIIKQEMNTDGFNIGLNLGRAGGAGVPGHLHWHLVPRWEGDHNFMAVISDTHVIPQSLQALFDLLVQKLTN